MKTKLGKKVLWPDIIRKHCGFYALNSSGFAPFDGAEHQRFCYALTPTGFCDKDIFHHSPR